MPAFAKEYAKKYGKQDRIHLMKLHIAQIAMTEQASKTIKDLVQDVSIEKNDPLTTQKRYGHYLFAFLSAMHEKSLTHGTILELPQKTKMHYGEAKKFQCMKNYQINSWVLEMGKTHISIGCGDFAQLLFGTFHGDGNEQTFFHGVDFAMVSITRCKLLHRMLLDNASSRSILQVWFSSCWSETTLEQFLFSCKSLMNGNSLAKEEQSLVGFWLTNTVTVKNACSEWFKGVENSIVSDFKPCANFRHEIDRVEYARYLFTGYIFVEKETSLVCGNRTMFAIPEHLGTSKVVGEI